MTEDQNKYAERIARLLRKAESTSPAEAEALVRKAQELMTRYAIDDAMLADGEIEKIVEETLVYAGTYRKANMRIGFIVAAANRCQSFYSEPHIRDDNGRRIKAVRVHVVGYESDVARVKLLASSLDIQCVRALTAFWRAHETKRYMTAMERFKERREFIFGFASGLRGQLREAAKVAEEEVVREESARTGVDAAESVALVLRNREDTVKDWFDKEYGGGLRTSRVTYTPGTVTARSRGYTAGRSADTGSSRVQGGGGELRG